MSKLYANIRPDTGASNAHRPSRANIEIWAQTEQGRITVYLNAQGKFTVALSPVYGYQACGETSIVSGNVNAGEVFSQGGERSA